ncbi:hypothetical protein AGABI2DRAFT_179054 [Agaricus bisporus var. bisporus H97]|uniref:hypothetical protein n=1 Tax=Agaricus bisporus var. bisporus (strain H97 / ATCC MYA-4626 / FGSC 10389) TaxID=936046 RepID=UPI00029F6A98|nr:hypothetical protein AGABI2DRAFT_179054 [Agaricus bisporus var. bisporus H97]EKV46873.1 hypothetical protein AGABI2DRAFT_179054 [Agaricus bisporus var. bisporus H97]
MSPSTRVHHTHDILAEGPVPHPLSPVDPSSDAADKFTHLKSTPPNAERAQKLKALPGCQSVRNVVLEITERWGKTFELTDQEHCFNDLGLIESLKKKTNSDLIQKQFEAVENFSDGVRSCFVEFQELRKPFDDLVSAKNMIVTQQVEEAIQLLRKGLQQNAKKMGQNTDFILGCRSDIWEFRKTAKETQNIIESILYAEDDQQEKIQFDLDMLEDRERIAPMAVGTSGFVVAAFEVVAKHETLKLAEKYKHKILESKMLQDSYKVEKSKADALNQKLDESENNLKDLDMNWLNLGNSIYTDILIVIGEIDQGKVPFATIAKELDEMEGKLLTMLELIENFLAQITQGYGQKPESREVKRICSRVPDIFTALEMLLSAKEVVVDDHQLIYEEHIYELSQAISEHFDNMKEVYWERKVATTVERQETFLRDDVPKFESAIPLLDAIKDIAKYRISKSKSVKADKKRRKEDMSHGKSALTRPGRPLVTGDEILWARHKVNDALLLLQMVSRASDECDKSTSKTANGREESATTNGTKNTVASRTLEWFRMPDEIINQFYTVLFVEARKLHFLKGNGERQTRERLNFYEEPGGRFIQLRRLMPRRLN